MSSELRQPAATPDPAAEDGIENRAHEHLAQQKRPERDALADGADNDVAGGLHENDFKQGQQRLPAS